MNQDGLLEKLMLTAVSAPSDRKELAIRVLLGDKELLARLVDSVEENPEFSDSFLGLKELGSLLNVSPSSLSRWRIPGHELGGRRRFRLHEVKKYLESGKFKQLAAELRRTRADARRKKATQSQNRNQEA